MDDRDYSSYLLGHLAWIAAAMDHWSFRRRRHALRSRPGRPRAPDRRRPLTSRRLLPSRHWVPAHRRRT